MAATAPATEPIPRVTDDEKQGAIAADITARDSAPGSATGTIVETGDASKLESGEAVAKPAPGPGLQIPDGGLDAWLVVLGGWLILFCTFGSVNAFGVYQTYYVRTLGKSDSEVAWIGSFQLWLQFTAGIVVGPVFDNGHGRKLMIGGSVLYIICLFMLSLCKEYYQVFLAQGVGIGVSLGILFLPSISVIPQWFSKRRAFATGIVVSGSSVGGVTFPIMINQLLESRGYAYTVRATAYLITGCLIIACALIKFRIPGRKHRPPHMQLPAPNIKAIVQHRAYQVTIAGAYFIMWGLFLPIFFMQTFAELHGVDSNLAFYLLSILNAASIFGRLLPNFLADKFGNYNLVICASGASSVLIFIWPVAKSKGALIVFALLYGFFSGAYVSLLPGCLTSLSSHVGEIGARIGLGWSVVAIAALTGPPILGALLGSGPFYWWRPTGFGGASVAIGTLLLLLARRLHAKEKGTSKI